MATKYEELSQALVVWNQARTDYDQQSIDAIASFVRGLVKYLGVTEKEIVWVPRPGDTLERNQQVYIAGSRYWTEREGYAFSPALIIRPPAGSPVTQPPMILKIPVEFYRARMSDQSFTFRLFDKDHKLSDWEHSTFEPLYDIVVDAIKQKLLRPVTPKGSVSPATITN